MFVRALLLTAAAVSSLILARPADAREAPAMRDRPVILIGVDGFRAEYLQRGITPTLSRLAAEGVQAEGGMRPSWPSVTFPNFYTLVTGLHPDHHGLVYNTMTDPRLPGRRFSLGNRAEVMDRVWYDDGEPIWVTAHNAGFRTAAMFWPGSEAPVRGVRPDYWVPYEKGVPSLSRVNILLGWMSLPPEERPAIATLYFDIVDTAGHHDGPDAPETMAAVAEVDMAVKALVEGLERLHLDADLVIVADHGMAALSGERVAFLDDLVDPTAITVTAAGAVVSLDPVPGREAEVEAALLGVKPHMECWRKGEIPARLAYGTHARVPAIVCLVETGWTVGTRDRTDPARVMGGAHGFDNQAPEMRALFIAHGPAFGSGVRLTEMDSVDVEPLLVRLLGIEGPAVDGRAGDTLPAMAR
ncbi:ectonucleotide pyrophosphatase/phosphodiesterase [Brevundimonas sp. FT23042]|uniref:alkaline phosphatase family protein n=1 Tax=Brevundimonas sp. FT23042 TaxID=3393749 RepID=UPI003B587524